MKERHEDYPSIVEAFFLIVGLFGAEFLISALLHDIGISTGNDQQNVIGIVEILGYGLLFCGLLAYKRLSYRDLFHQSKQSATATIGILFLPILAVIPAITLAASALQSVLEWFFPISPWEQAMFDRMMSNGLASVVTVCIIAPVLEEMLFRGIILRSFLRQHSPTVAIVASALLFGAAHLNIYQFVAASLMGLALGWLYERTRSLWPSIFLHASYNFTITVIDMNSSTATKSEFPDISFLYWMLAFGLAFASMTLMSRLLRSKQ